MYLKRRWELNSVIWPRLEQSCPQTKQAELNGACRATLFIRASGEPQGGELAARQPR